MLIKEITNEDFDVFRSLCMKFYSSNATQRPYDEQSTISTFQHIIEKHENLWGFFITDSATGDYAGYSLITSYWCNEESGNVLIVDELYIDMPFRHKGFATGFLEWLVAEYRGKAVSLTLEVLANNIIAKELYAKEGFYEDGFVTLSKKLI